MRKVSVKVIPGAKIDQVQPGIDGSLKVWIKAEPKEGRANRRLIEMLAKYYKTDKKSISITLGLTSRNKIIKVDQ